MTLDIGAQVGRLPAYRALIAGESDTIPFEEATMTKVDDNTIVININQQHEPGDKDFVEASIITVQRQADGRLQVTE